MSNSFMEFFAHLAAKFPPQEPLYWVESRPLCPSCGSCEVPTSEDLCDLCKQEKQHGYQVLTMTGRRANGAQRDSGRRYHAVKFGEIKALCNAKPGRHSDWSPYHGQEVTCPRCAKKINKGK